MPNLMSDAEVVPPFNLWVLYWIEAFVYPDFPLLDPKCRQNVDPSRNSRDTESSMKVIHMEPEP